MATLDYKTLTLAEYGTMTLEQYRTLLLDPEDDGNFTTLLRRVPPLQELDIELIQDDDYGPTAKSFPVIWRGGEWPSDLDDYAWSFLSKPVTSNINSGDALSGTVSVSVAIGDGRALRVAIAAAATAEAAIGWHNYSIRGSRDDENWVVARGLIKVSSNNAST